MSDGVKKFTPRLTRQSAPPGSDEFARKVDENLLAIQGVSASVSTRIANVEEVIGSFSSSPWLGRIQVYVSPGGVDDVDHGTGWDKPVKTGYYGYRKIVASGGGVLHLGEGWVWGGPVVDQGMWIRGDGADIDGFLPAVSCVIRGWGGPGEVLFQQPGQAKGTAGATNNSAYPDRLKPAFWLVKTEHLIRVENITFEGSVYTPYRTSWDYNRDATGGIINLAVTSATLNSSDNTIAFTVTLPTGFTPLTYSHDTAGNVSIGFDPVNPPTPYQTFPPWRRGQIVRITSTNPNVPSGDYPVLTTVANLDGSSNWSFTYNDGTHPGSPTSGAGTGITIQSHACGGEGEDEYIDLHNGATNTNILGTEYQVKGHTATTITVANPYAGTKVDVAGVPVTLPTTGTFTGVGTIAHQERVYCPVQRPIFNNCSATMPLGTDIKYMAGTGPCWDFGSGISLGPILMNCQAQGLVPSTDTSYVIEPNRMAGIFVSPGSKLAPIGIGFWAYECTAGDGGLRVICGQNTSSVYVENWNGDVGTSAARMPPAVYVEGNEFTTVDVFSANQNDASGGINGIRNVVTRGIPPANVRSKRSGIVDAPGESGDLIPSIWNSYPTPKSPWEMDQITLWGDGRRITGDHPAGRRTAGPVGARFPNMVVSPTLWTATGSASVTLGQPDPFGGNTAVKLSGSGFVNIRPYTGDGVNTVTAGGRFIMAGWFCATAGLPSAGNGLLYMGGDPGAIVFDPFINPNPNSWAVIADVVDDGWLWQRGLAKVVSTTNIHPNYFVEVQVLGSDIYCYGLTVVYVPASIKDVDCYEGFYTLKHQPLALPPGMTGTMEGQPLIAHGGVGVDTSVLTTPSGTAAPTKNLPLLKADGTVQGYLPVIPTNSGLAAGTVTSVGATAPVTSTGGATPTIALNIDGSLGVSGGNLQRAALTGDATAAAGSNAITVPTKGKVLVSVTDPTPDYLDTKFESTTGNILVSHILGPPEFVNINVDPALLGIGDIVTELVYYVEINSTVLATLVANGTSWIPMGSVTGFTPSVVEYPVAGPVATVAQMDIAVLANPLSGAGTLGFELTKNGGIGGAAIATISVGTGSAAFRTTGQFALSSIAATDTWGLAIAPVSAPSVGGSTFRASVRIRLATQAW